MEFRIKTKIDTELIARVLDAACKVDSESGEVSFTGGEMTEASAVLQTVVEFNKEIPLEQVESVIRDAVFEAGRSGEITIKSLREHLNRQENKVLRAKPKRYKILSSLSLKVQGKIPRRKRINGVTIDFFSEIPRPLSRELLAVGKDDLIEIPQGYLVFRASAWGRNPISAMSKAIDGVDLLRAHWNLALNRRIGHRYSSRAEPINGIRLGQSHSVHNDSGKLAVKWYWYEPSYYHKVHRETPAKWEQALEIEAVQRKALRRSKYQTWIEEGMVRYVRALDGVDHERSFILLWGVLEYLTDSTNYDQAVRRAAFLYKDFAYAKTILEHLRISRNSSIHDGRNIQLGETLLCQLKHNVEELLSWHLFDSLGAATAKEAVALLDLPWEKSELSNTIRMHERALRLRYPKS